MSNHKYYSLYKSSFAISGLRGTLSQVGYNSELQGKFYGKTGTLKNVRTVSGILESIKGPIYISILTYGIENPDQKITDALIEIKNSPQCFS